MKSKIRFLANEIKITRTKGPVVQLLIAGLLLSSVGLLMLIGAIYSFLFIEKLLFGLGIIIFSGGLLLLFKQHNIIISINSSRGIIEIKNIYATKKVTGAFPISQFSKITVYERLVKQAKDKMVTVYEIYLNSNGYTTLLLTEFTEKEDAFEFANTFQELILLDIYYMEKVYKKSEFKLKASNAHNDIRLSDTTMLKKYQKESEIVYKWKREYPVLSLFFLIGILFGIYDIFHFVIMQGKDFIPVSFLEYAILGGLLFVMLLFYLLYYHQAKTIHLGREAITYHLSILGIKSKKADMNWDDVAQVWNTVSAPRLSIINKKGFELFEEIIELSSKKSTPEVQSEISERVDDFAKQQLVLDVAALPVSDRIKIELEILNFIV